MPLIFSGMFLSVHASRAAVTNVITPTGAAATNTIASGFDRIAAYTINGNGLVGTQHVNFPPDGTMWLTDAFATVTAADITFDLGSPQTFDSVRIWNYNEGVPLLTNRSARNVSISTSNDNLNFSPPHAYVFAQAPGTGTYTGETYGISSTTAQYIKLSIADNYGGDSVGLSEVRFQNTTPTKTNDLLRPTAIAAVSTELGAPFFRLAVNSIDGTGLNAAGEHDNSSQNGVAWLTDFQTTGSIVYDLGASVLTNGFRLWNYNESGGFTARGVNTADISTSIDGITYTTPQPYSFAQAPGSGTYAGDNYPLTPVLARYIKIDNATNFGGGFADTLGISEIRFATPSLITGVTATASSSYLPDGRTPDHLVDNSGISGALNERAGASPGGNMWLTDFGNTVGSTVTFDLNGLYPLEAARIWNYNESGGSFTDRGIQLLDVATSLDGSAFTTLVGPVSGHFQLNQAPGTVDYVTSDMLDFSGELARYVRFTVVSKFGTSVDDQYVGLSEVRFYVPEPTSAVLLALGFVPLLRKGRRAC